ncbi:hypothetical protein H2200_004996 [Cladophialophora chaetospira]|uniref:F-box domain-containing protein n=1 Tax=Cladophialophora chaetospira TaxID=386627 RepID=A0AA38XBT4_9EURO|nr:hypothetical protein H2200_004996 [Cladophialophora chaetospira]
MALPKILDLEVEVLASIFEFVDDESPRSTTAIAQTCKSFLYAVKLIRYRRLTVQWDHDTQTWLSSRGRPQQEWETEDLLRGLRHLTVKRGNLPNIINDRSDVDDENDDDDDDENGDPADSTAIDIVPFSQLESVFRNASNLKTISWKVGYFPPCEVTKAIVNHQPNAKMNLFRAERLANRVGLLDSEKTLATSSCLNTLSMTASYGTCIEDHMTFQIVVALAPNLKFASLVSLPVMRPSDSELSNRYRSNPDLWFPREYANRKPNSSLRHLTLDGWSLSAESLDYWARFVDLSSLESFKCSRGSIYSSYFQRASQLLTNLKHVSLNLNSQERNEETSAAIEHYIATCPPLLTLSLWSWRGGVSLSTIFNQHGTTLTALHLHEREDDWYTLRDTLSLEELRLIRESCPQLKDFTFDLNRVSRQLDLEDYQNTTDELREFRLNSLQIYLDCGLPWLAAPDRGDFQNPPRGPPRETADGELPGNCYGDSQYEAAVPIIVQAPRLSPTAPPPPTLTAQPPSTNREICRFLIGAWKAIFGSQTTGARQLDIKFGEVERKAAILPRLRGKRNLTVWARARPHERDDKQGECFVEIECCGGEHKRKFASC